MASGIKLLCKNNALTRTHTVQVPNLQSIHWMGTMLPLPRALLTLMGLV